MNTDFPWVAGSSISLSWTNAQNSYQSNSQITVSVLNSPSSSNLTSTTTTIGAGTVNIPIPSSASGSNWYMNVRLKSKILNNRFILMIIHFTIPLLDRL